jgi:hypothetical protein
MDDTAAAFPTAPQESGFADARELLAIIASPERHAALVGELKARIAAAEEGAAALIGERKTFDADIRERTAALASEHAALVDRHVAVVEKCKTLQQRRDRLAELSAAWRNIGEDDDVCRGFRDPEHSGLHKARCAYGLIDEPPDEDHLRDKIQLDPHFSEQMPVGTSLAHSHISPLRAPPSYVPPPATKPARRGARRRGMLAERS